MWVVTKVGFIDKLGKIKYEMFVVVTDFLVRTSSLAIHLRNTESGDYKVLYNKDNPDFIRQLKELNPIGFINYNKNSDMLLVDDILVAVDDYSLQFQGYVKSVREINVMSDKELYNASRDFDGSFFQVDKGNLLFKTTGPRPVYCTLFHAACSCQKNWYKDSFYLYRQMGVGDKALLSDIVDSVYRVEFSDVQAASRLLTKAGVSGINPVSEHLSYKDYWL